MKLNELRKMVDTALREFSAGGGTLGTGSGYYEQQPAPFEEPEHEEQSTMTSFAEDEEEDRPEGKRSIANVREEIHNLMGAAMETLKAPTEAHQKKYYELMMQLQPLNQELENLSNAKEKQQEQQQCVKLVINRMDIGDLVLWREEILAFFLLPAEDVENIASHIGIIVGEGDDDDGREFFEIIWAVSKVNKTYVEYIFKEDMENWFYTIPKTKSVEQRQLPYDYQWFN